MDNGQEMTGKTRDRPQKTARASTGMLQDKPLKHRVRSGGSPVGRSRRREVVPDANRVCESVR